MNEQLITSKYAGLNNEQKQAVDAMYGPVLVIAGAGSGKTNSMTVRIARMIKQGIQPDNILAVTFTRKAANEMTERLELMVGEQPMKRIWMGTFHSICIRILKKHGHYLGMDANEKDYANFTLYDTGDQLDLLKRIINRRGKADDIKPGLASHYISECKNKLWNPEYAMMYHAENKTNEELSLIYQEYQDELEQLNAIDFDDCIMKTVELLRDYDEPQRYWQNKFQFVLTDEFQDCNYAQLQLLLLISAPHFNLFVVGDDAQAIYGFRGSDITIILGFQTMFPTAKIITLEQNYRSKSHIVLAGNAIIEHNTKQMPKKLKGNKGQGEAIQEIHLENEVAEAAFLATMIKKSCITEGKSYKDFAILYRSNAQSRVIEDFFRNQFIPFRVIGGTSFYQREEIKDIVAYLRTVFNPKDDISLMRILNKPTRGIGKTTQIALEDYAHSQKISIYRALKNPEDIPGLNKRAYKNLRGFRAMLDEFIKRKETMSSQGFTKYVMNQSGLRLHYEKSKEAEERIDNLDEFLKLVLQYETEYPDKTMDDYLQEIALITDADSGNQLDAVQLMTIHGSKGLEFPVVFLVGWSEGLFPSWRCTEIEDIEEDRRCAYVAITRAEEMLYITHTDTRKQIDGKKKHHEPSRFLSEIPGNLKKVHEISI